MMSQCDVFGWTVPLRAKFLLCSSSGSSWPDFLAPSKASTLPWLSWEEESSCTVSGPEASWTEVSTSPSSLVNSSLFILIFPGALLGFALGCRVIAVVGMQYLNHVEISSALQTFLQQNHYVFFQLFTHWIVGVFDIHTSCAFFQTESPILRLVLRQMSSALSKEMDMGKWLDRCWIEHLLLKMDK